MLYFIDVNYNKHFNGIGHAQQRRVSK